MLPFTGGRPQKDFIADAVRERMARLQQATAVKTSSSASPPSPATKTTSKRKHDDITIDLTDDSDDPRPDPQHKAPRLISLQSPVNKQRCTPLQDAPRSPLAAPMAPSLLQKALDAASLGSPVESPQSPTDNAKGLKRKRDLSPDLELGPLTPDDDEASPRSPIEEAEARTTAAAHRSVGSPRNSVEEIAPRPASARAAIESPQRPVEETAPPVQASSSIDTGFPTPHPSQKSKDIKNTEISDRFAPNTIDGVEYRNPAKFSFKPPYWHRWDSRTYVKFAEQLRWQFDPVHFAKASGIPVEEVQHVFNAVVCNPLYNFKVAEKRGEEGMKEIVKLYQSNKLATEQRPWGKKEEGQKQFMGEIKGVRKGEVELVLNSGNKRIMPLVDLREEDAKYLWENLREEDKGVLWG